MKRALIPLLVLVASCGKDVKKPYFDAKQTFADTIASVARIVPFAQAPDPTAPAWYLELSAYARGRISQISVLATQRFERESAKLSEAATPSSRLASGFSAIAIACKPKIAVVAPDHQRPDTEALEACEHAIDRLDTTLKDLDGESVAAGLPAGTFASIRREPPEQASNAELAGLKRLLEVGVAEAKWRAVRDDQAAAPEALKAACDEAAQEASRAADAAPPIVRDVYEARTIHAKGRKLLLMEADRFAAMEATELAAKTDRDKLCVRLRGTVADKELPKRYTDKLTALAKTCP